MKLTPKLPTDNLFELVILEIIQFVITHLLKVMFIINIVLM